MIIAVFDIETTGSNQFSNKCFAVGYCIGRINTEKPARVLKKGKWTVDLGKPSDTSWEKFWIKQGWDMRRYNQFWSEHLDILERLAQNNDRLPDEAALARAINYLLGELERDHKDFVVGFDTVAFDSVWIATMLQKRGFAGITQNRDGDGYRSVYEVDSYRFGVFGVELENWKQLNRAVADCITHPSIEPIENLAHDPEVDAYNIFADFANTHDYRHLPSAPF